MIILKLLYIGLILAVRTSSLGNNLEIIDRLPNNTKPVHYDIDITPYLEEGNFTFYGESNVKIEICYVLSEISLHSRDLEINEEATTLINDKGTVHKPMKHIHNSKTNILTLNFNNALLPGLYILHMKFAGNLSDPSKKQGFMKFSYYQQHIRWLAVTQFAPNNARRMFPCWDEPALKATFNISVMCHKHIVVSNMPILEQYYEQEDMIRTYFEATPVMSTYVVAIAVFDFLVLNTNETFNINKWWFKLNSSFALKVKFAYCISEKILEILTQYTNSSLKILKMDHILIPGYTAVSSMGNWGLITYDESSVTYDDGRDPTYRKIEVVMSVARELAFQWFGSLVTPSWWTHVWLSEGIASFTLTFIIEKIFKLRTQHLLQIQDIQRCLLQDTVGSLNSVTLKFDNTLDQFLSLYSVEIYKKSSVLLRMLQNTITYDVFRNGLITYLARHQFNSVTPDDLWNAMQSALNESDIPHEDYKIKEVMDTWMNQERYPFVHVERNYETGEVTISQIRARQFEEPENKTTKWWIPITFATQSNPEFSNTVPHYWLQPDQHNISFKINPNDWIIVNLQLTGYYRVSYDIRNWQKISNFLNTNEYSNIHVLNRAQIIADSHAMVLDDRLEGHLHLLLISYLRRDRNYVAWQPLLDIIETMPTPLLLPEMNHVKKQYKYLLHNLLRHMNYVENPDDDDITKQIRLTAIKCACNLGIKKCKKMTALKLSKHIADPNTYKLRRGERFLYCTGMIAANRTVWDRMFELYLNGKLTQQENRLLKGLSCAEDPDIIINYLNILALNTSLFRDNVYSDVFKGILKRHVHNDKVLKYILNNFNIIKPRSLNAPAMIKLILENVYFFKHIDKVERFSQTNFNNDSKTLSEIKKLITYGKEYLWKVIDNVKRKFESKKFYNENLFSRYSPREKRSFIYRIRR